MRKIVLTFGLIAGAIMSVLMLGNMAFVGDDFDKGLILGYTTIVLAFLLIFAGVKSYRDNVAGGSVGFVRALTVGLLITVVASVCYVAAWELVGMRLHPDFADKYAEYTIAKERESGASDAQILAKTKEMQEFKESYSNPLVNSTYTFLEPLPVGIVFALVTAGILSRKRREEIRAS